MKRLAIFFFFISILCTLCTAKTLTINDGLAGESVYKIYKDKHGILWTATNNGITSFDGNQTKSFSVSSVRSKNRINDLTFHNRSIWAAATSGLYYMEPEQGRFSLFNENITENITAVCSTDKLIFAGTANGLYLINGRKYEHLWLSPNHMSKLNSIEDIAIDKKGRVWILTANELFLFNPETRKFLPMQLSKSFAVHNGLRNLSVADDRIFMGSYNDGLYIFDFKAKKGAKYIDVNCQVITQLKNDGKNLYVATDGQGLMVVSLATNKIIRQYSTAVDSPVQLLDNTVYSFYKDHNGVCFFGYYRRGLQYEYRSIPLFDCYRFGSFNSADVGVRSFCIDDHIKVLGTRNGLYYINENTNTIRYFSPEMIGGSIVTNVVKYNDNYYCSTFNGGVVMLDASTLSVSRFGKSDELRIGSFGCMKVHDGKLWMSGNVGVIIYDSTTGEEQIYNSRNSQLYAGYANNLFFDRQERCWISTAGGICLYDPVDKVIRSTGFPQGFFNKQSETSAIQGDKDNLLFVSTDGIFRTNEELTDFGPIDTKATIGNDYTSQALYDNRLQNYWLGTERGMYRFNADFSEVARFSQLFGLNSHEFSNQAITLDKNRTLWTGTANGLFYANIDKINNYKLGKLNIVFSNGRIDTKELTPNELFTLLNDHKITLSYNWETQILSFLPILLDYSDPEGMCFEYRFGKSDKWYVLKNREYINTKGQLHWGRNTLQIRLAGQPDIEEFYIYVWPSTLFVVECIFILIALLIAFFSYRQRLTVEAQREEMQRVQQELEETRKKYNRINTNQDEQQRLFHMLDNYLRNEKVFLNTDLKLSDIASHLACSTVKLSQLLNVFLNTNYYDFINKYRLEEFKLRFHDKRYANYTLLALAEECGFKRSSFFSTFKKVEGKTPTEWAKENEQ